MLFTPLSQAYGGTVATVVVVAIWVGVCLLWALWSRHLPPPTGPTRDRHV
jgi:hypothetical protein